MKIRKEELGKVIVDDARSFDIVQVKNSIYVSLYSDASKLPKSYDGNSGYEMDLSTYTAAATDYQTLDSIRNDLLNGKFDQYVSLAKSQEAVEAAKVEQKETLKQLGKTDYREIKFVCQLIKALSDGASLETIQELASDFECQYPGHLENKDRLRASNRIATTTIECEDLPF